MALLTGLVMAGETPPAPKENGAATARESVEQLIEQLDAADYDTREAACGKLAAKGKAAIAAIEKAAAHGNLEVSSRATTILGKLLKSSDEATEKAANAALQHLADGDSPAAARKARSILDKKNGLKANAPGMGGIVMPGNGFGQIIINGGQLNIGGGGAMRTMSVKNVNGVKEITASEDGKTVKIQDDPAQGIKIELTEKQNGKEVTKKYDAKNVEELKKQPAGYELYKKYGGEQPGNGILQFGIQAGAGNLQIQGNAFPAIPLMPAMPLLPGQPMIPGPVGPGAAIPQGNSPQVEVATMMVKNLSYRLERLQKAETCKNASPESKAELKKQIDELSKRLGDLRGQLGDK
ncbi:MAG: hypothetical protein WCJ35_19255 [Planctomycetota bacterium]